MNELIELNDISSRIYTIRGTKVMLDRDLAELYGVETRRLKEQVKRNADRFPLDFMFELSYQDLKNLRSQFATSSWAVRAISQWHLQSKVWPCYPVFFTAKGLFK